MWAHSESEPKTKRYVERDAKIGRFMNVKSDKAPFKDVVIENIADTFIWVYN